MLIELKRIKLNVECTWGEGPDVLLSIDSPDRTLQIVDLTKEEAKSLGMALLNAAKLADDLEQMCEDHDSQMGLN